MKLQRKYTLKFSPDSNILDLNSQVQTPFHTYEEWKPPSELQDAGAVHLKPTVLTHPDKAGRGGSITTSFQLALINSGLVKVS